MVVVGGDSRLGVDCVGEVDQAAGPIRVDREREQRRVTRLAGADRHRVGAQRRVGEQRDQRLVRAHRQASRGRGRS